MRPEQFVSPPPPPSPFPQGIARLARAKKDYQANLRKTFGGCLASNKLKGFASEGREVPESAGSRSGSGDDNFDGGRSLSAQEYEDGPWSEGSESEESCSSSSSSDEEDTKEAQDRRVEALYNIATGGGDGNGDGDRNEDKTAPAVLEENSTAVDTTTATTPEKEAAAVKTVTVEAGTAAPCSEPEVIPLSALPALAKEFAVAEKPSEEPPQPDLAAPVPAL